MQRRLKLPAIIFLWLVHISAIIGIKIGLEDFFIPLTLYNLSFITVILIYFYPIQTTTQILLFLGISLSGFLFEVLGVETGKIFGEYSYGNNLGFKFLGVPLIIGLNWGVLCFASSGIVSSLKLNSIFIKAFLASFLMILLDFFMEYSAPIFDFWKFKNPLVPIQNYISWFLLAFLFNLLIFKFVNKKNSEISLHILGVQFLFFFFFYVS